MHAMSEMKVLDMLKHRRKDDEAIQATTRICIDVMWMLWAEARANAAVDGGYSQRNVGRTL
jgi:hypothetical protein